MCGICGLINLDGSTAETGGVLAIRERLSHRGPDDEGMIQEGPACLGFRRLSILDLQGGHQPMSSPDGRFSMVFNGEIYNHPELKASLESEGVRFRTRSDTETLLHLFARLGAEAFPKLNGMFAVAVYDARSRELVLARDPMGIKPLYYFNDAKRLIFSSELRALLAAGIPGQVDASAAAEYLAFGRVHAPRTMLKGVRKLEPGHYLIAGARGVRVQRYWDPPSGTAEFSSESEALEALEGRIQAAVKRQLLSDVPVGAFLSGGVDSSLITAFMAQEGRAVSTFSIGFKDAPRGLDESGFARSVSRHLGTRHHEMILPRDVLGRIEDLGPSLDEPVADSAILPTFLLARFAQESVKVVLTGEGADELFAGYNRHKAAFLSERVSNLPVLLRPAAAWAARRFGKGRVFSSLPHHSVADWRRALAEPFEDVLPGAGLPLMEGAEILLTLQEALRSDMNTTMVDSLLMKVDKATMRASLEARVPFLDLELVSFGLRLPSRLKMRRLKGKYLLRRLAERCLPREIAWRRKHGFVVPWQAWLGSESARELIHTSLPGLGLFDPERVNAAYGAFLNDSPGRNPGLVFKLAVLGLWVKTLADHNTPVTAARSSQ